MPRIFLIGSNAARNDYEDILSSHGHSVVKYSSLDIVLPRIDDKIDLLVIEIKQNLNPSFKQFIKLSRAIPKIILTDTKSLRGLTHWIKEPFVYPLYSPGDKELLFFVKRLLQERELTIENTRLKNELSITKRELNFYQEVNRTLTSSLELGDILTTIMKRAKAMTKAQAWSVLLVDEETGQLVFERAEGTKARDIKKYRLKVGEGIAGWVAQEGIPVVVPDVSKDQRFLGKIDKAIRFKTKDLKIVY